MSVSNEIVSGIVQVGLPVTLLNPVLWLALLWVVVKGKSGQVAVGVGAVISALTASVLVRLPKTSVPEFLTEPLANTSSITTVLACLIVGALLGLLVGGGAAACRKMLANRQGSAN